MSSKQQAQRTRRKARSRNNILRRIQTSVLYLTTNCKIFDQKKVAFSEHHHVTRNKTSTERCEKWPATQVPAFQFHSPQTLFIKVPLTGAIFTTRHEGETQSRANSRIETQKKEKNLQRLSPAPAIALCVFEPQTKPATGRNKRGRKRNYSLRENKGQASPSIATNC